MRADSTAYSPATNAAMAAPTWATARFIDARNSGPAKVARTSRRTARRAVPGWAARGVRPDPGRGATSPVGPARRPRTTRRAPTAIAARKLRHAAAGTGSKAVSANEVATYADPKPIAASAANSSPR